MLEDILNRFYEDYDTLVTYKYNTIIIESYTLRGDDLLEMLLEVQAHFVILI
jgi:hypothetical protein